MTGSSNQQPNREENGKSHVRVLIVEDEEFLAEAIHDRLAMESITAQVVGDGDAALAALLEQDFDVVLLDRDIPGVHGDEVARRLAADPQGPAVLMLTAAGDLEERVAGLELGADDYMSKPFEFAELIARLRALSRRKFTTLPPVLERGGIRVDSVRREVSRDGTPIALTPKEFTVLELLMQAGGGVLSAETLLEQAWDANANPFTHAVKVTISTLRRKLGEPSPIKTVSGAGYGFV
ncbi:two-component system response regulator VanR [Paeniglutamicibacter kerguelensis]|uniref:Two-component system response regulator VanR n=1 Tax=Paeniglutamicibacter kerguelensis TaxID=254788 RepID=A0ABS4XGE9_9MICC|nr:response regulator transcription factor [Paeniglutamicibacter kerguelensis]MBP2387539.1 two-component system response regulator VanR [Paeniglutamicibacter kerguelensis]